MHWGKKDLIADVARKMPIVRRGIPFLPSDVVHLARSYNIMASYCLMTPLRDDA